MSPFCHEKWFDTKYSGMGQEKFVGYSLEKIQSDIVCKNRPYHFKSFKGCILDYFVPHNGFFVLALATFFMPSWSKNN